MNTNTQAVTDEQARVLGLLCSTEAKIVRLIAMCEDFDDVYNLCYWREGEVVIERLSDDLGFSLWPYTERRSYWFFIPPQEHMVINDEGRAALAAHGRGERQ